MARKYPRKNRKKLKWFDPFNRNKPLEVFADSDDESPSKLSGVAKRKQNKKPSKASMEQEVPRNFKQFMRGIKDFESEENRKREMNANAFLFTPSAKKKAMNSTMNKDDKNDEKPAKVKKISSLEQWRRDTKRERQEDKELDQEEKEYFQDRVLLHERVDAPPLDLKPPVATLRNVQNQNLGIKSNLPSTPKTKSMLTPNSKLKEISLSAKKIISSVKSDVKFKRKKTVNLTEVKPRGNSSKDLIAERERVVQAYRELKFKKNKNLVLINNQALTPVEI